MCQCSKQSLFENLTPAWSSSSLEAPHQQLTLGSWPVAIAISIIAIGINSSVQRTVISNCFAVVIVFLSLRSRRPVQIQLIGHRVSRVSSIAY